RSTESPRPRPAGGRLSRSGLEVARVDGLTRASLGSLRGPADEVEYHAGQLLTLVLLEEVAGSGDDRVRLAAGARNRLAQERVGAPRDRVRVAEGGEERLLPAAEHLPRPAVRRRRRIVGRGRDEQREAPRPGLVALVGKGCVVGGDHLRRELGDATGL